MCNVGYLRRNIHRDCIVCGVNFHVNTPAKLTCSYICRRKQASVTAAKRRAEKNLPQPCIVCKVDFKNTQTNQKICSPSCRSKHRLELDKQRRQRKFQEFLREGNGGFR